MTEKAAKKQKKIDSKFAPVPEAAPSAFRGKHKVTVSGWLSYTARLHSRWFLVDSHDSDLSRHDTLQIELSPKILSE